MIDNSKPARDMMTSIIYEELFGKSRIQMVTESKPHWDAELVALWNGDLDEIIRDYMTSEALEILGKTELACGLFIRMHSELSIRELMPITREIAKQSRLMASDFKVWQWETTE